MCRDESIIKAKKCAYRLLKWRQRTKQELFLELSKKGFSREVVSQTIDDLCSYGMLNDELLAKNLVQKRLSNSKWGKRRIKQELAYRKVPSDITSSVLQNITEEMELDIALQLVDKKVTDSHDISLNKLKAFLDRRGFSLSVIAKAGKYIRELE